MSIQIYFFLPWISIQYFDVEQKKLLAKHDDVYHTQMWISMQYLDIEQEKLIGKHDDVLHNIQHEHIDSFDNVYTTQIVNSNEE